MNIIQKPCLILTIIGGLNWGLVGLFNFNLVETITGGFNIFSRIIYVIVAIAAIVNVILLFIDLSDQKKATD